MAYNKIDDSPLDIVYGNISLSTGISAISGSYYTSTGDSTAIWSSPLTTTSKGRLELVGEDADIKINGESLMSTLQEIRNHLRLPNPVARDAEAEAEWAELQAAGEHYELLLKQYKEKQQMWNILKKEY